MSESKNNIPENFKIVGDWLAQSKALKTKFSLLTDSDLHLEPGKDAEMLSRLQQRLNKSREEAIKIVRSVENEKSSSPGPSKL